MTSELQQTRYDRLIRRVGGIIGPGSKVNEALSELFPVLDVERVPGELLRLSGTFIAFGGSTLTGAAGERPRIQLFNPVDSGNILTVTQFQAAPDVNATVRYGVDTIALTTGVGTQTHRDLRTLPPTLPVGEIRQQSSVALAPGTGLLRALADTTETVKDSNGVAVLLPGSGLQVGLAVLASTIFVTFFWRERAAQESELSV